MAGKRQVVALAAAVVLVGGVTACSSSSSTSTSASASASAPQTSASEASGIPSDVISGYFKATCTAPSTYDEATETCTDEQGQAQSVGEFAPSLALTPVRAMNLTVAYGFFPPDDFPACPPKADLDAYTDDTSGTVDPPAISDECMTSVLVALTGFMG